jgi:hypothetical protein
MEKQELDFTLPRMTDKDGNEIEFYSALEKIVRAINEKETIEESKGRLIVANFLHALMQKEDPFMMALATLGDDKAINALGILLFIAFQFGYNFGSKDLNFEPKE